MNSKIWSWISLSTHRMTGFWTFILGNFGILGSRSLIERIRLIRQTKIVVTHHLSVVVDLCERAVLLRGGRKAEDLPIHELLKNRDLLEQFGFDADFAQWMYERRKKD